jgi:hypothetical protein
MGGQSSPVHTNGTLTRPWLLDARPVRVHHIRRQRRRIDQPDADRYGDRPAVRRRAQSYRGTVPGRHRRQDHHGFLADRVNKCLLLASVLLLFMGAVFALAFARDLDDILLCSIVIGFSASSSLPLWHSLTASMFGVANFSRVIGLTQPLLFLLVLAGPPEAGKVRVVTGSYDLALFSFAAMLLVSLLLVIGVRIKERQTQAAQH